MTNIIKKYILWIVLALVLVLGGLLYAGHKGILQKDEETTEDYHNIEYEGKTYKFNSDIVSILFLGIDQSSDSSDQGQSDSITLVLLDRGEETTTLLTLPRDTITPIRFYDFEGNFMGYEEDHLSIAYSVGKTEEQGSIYVCDAVSKLLGGIPINYFVDIRLDDLSELQDIVGSISFTCPNSSLAELNEEWTEGNMITIDSSNVEDFVRKRDIEVNFSAMDRQERQQAYLQAYLEALQSKSDDEIETKIQSLFNTLTTNVSLEDGITFAEMAKSYKFNSIFTIPGDNLTGLEYDEYHVDETSLQKLIIQLYYKEKER